MPGLSAAIARPAHPSRCAKRARTNWRIAGLIAVAFSQQIERKKRAHAREQGAEEARRTICTRTASEKRANANECRLVKAPVFSCFSSIAYFV